MAKAGKKESVTRQRASQNGTDNVVPKSPAKGRAAKAPEPVGVTIEVVEVQAVPAPPIHTHVSDAPDAGDVVRQMREARAEVTALRTELRATREETAAALAALKADASAAALDVAELRRLCGAAGEKLVAEIGDQSLAMGRVRQAREQADDIVRGAGAAELDVRALRDECGKTGEALDALAAQTRTAHRDAFDAVRRLTDEVESLRARVADLRESTDDRRAAPDDDPVEPLSGPEAKQNRFGVTVAPGVVIADVVAESPAATAGLLRGDVIEEANGRPVQSGADLRDAANLVAPGEELTLQLRRGGELLVRTVKLGEATAEGGSRFGVTVAPGVVVAEVYAGSRAESAGLGCGDVIEEADGLVVQSGDHLLSIIHSKAEGAEVPLVVTRGGEQVELVARLDHA